MENTKLCKKCDTSKEVTEFFNNKLSKDGLSWYCKSCISEVNQKWRDKNKDKWNSYQRKYRKKHPTLARDAARKYRLNNKEKANQLVYNWVERNVEKYVQTQYLYQSKLPPGIYKVKYKDEVVYVGSSKRPLARQNIHMSTIKSESNLTSINKLFSYCGYDKNDFKTEMIEHCKVEELLRREKYWEAKYDAKLNYKQTFPDVLTIGEIKRQFGKAKKLS